MAIDIIILKINDLQKMDKNPKASIINESIDTQ